MLDRAPASPRLPKTFNDPIWGIIELYSWEMVLLDSVLLQRLRGVRQLGMAHLVYPGATHDRLEHIRGVVAGAQRMLESLERNAKHRRQFGAPPDKDIPLPTENDRWSVRLAALLHDIGHGPFSHATEPLLRERFAKDFVTADKVLREAFEGVARIAPSEILAALLVVSEAMGRLLDHPRLGIPSEGGGRDLAPAIAARLLGSRSYLYASYLSGIISGPLDADKLDYMARDSHHAGLPVGLDIDRLISKLEVVTVTRDNAPASLRDRVEKMPGHRIREVGIALAGLGAYEQMIIARVILYDRLYHHHKVRAAEAMVRQLVRLAEQERGRQITLAELLSHHSDDTMVEIWGGRLRTAAEGKDSPCSARLASAILERRIHHRAFAFAARFIQVPEGASEQDQHDARAETWNRVLTQVRTDTGCDELSKEIHRKALALASALPELFPEGTSISVEDVLVDFPVNKAVVRGGDILTRSDSGQVNLPNLFFDPERWSQAYEQQKQCGFVFAARSFVPLVALASKLVFFERFQIIMTEQADLASKTFGMVYPDWFQRAAERKQCTVEAALRLRGELKPLLVSIEPEDFVLPDSWRKADPHLAERLADGFQAGLPQGVTAELRTSVIDALRHLTMFADMAEKDGLFLSEKNLQEERLQAELRRHLRSREVNVREGEALGGGKTDLLLPGDIVIENKVRDRTADPVHAGQHYSWQARRYAQAICRQVVFSVVGYQPTDESARPPLPQRIVARKLESAPEDCVEVRLIIPWGEPVPSHAKAPPTTQ
jgi:HD superfamily phosphohydrolase